MKIIFSSNISWSIYNFRTPLLKSLQEDGHIIYTISSKDSKYCNEVKKQMSVSNSASYTLNPEAVEARANTLSKVEGIKLRENLYNCTKEIGKDIDEIYN